MRRPGFDLGSETRVACLFFPLPIASAKPVQGCDLLGMVGALLRIVPAPLTGHLIGGHEQLRAREAKPQVEVDGVSFLPIEAADTQP
jgi:hypothetical protein